MRPYRAWFGRLAMAGTCVAWAGCGGGAVPDPDSDPTAAPAEAPARVVDRGAAQAPDEAPAPEAPAPASTGPAAPNPPELPAAAANTPPPAAVASAPAEAEKTSTPLKGDASGTEEMMRMAASSTPPPGQASAPTSPPGAPGSPPAPGMERGDPSRGPTSPGQGPAQPAGPASAGQGPTLPAGPSVPGGPGMPGAPGVPGGPGMIAGPGVPGGPGMIAGPGVPGGPGAGGIEQFTGLGGPGTPGGPDSSGGPGGGPNGSGDLGPATFRHPQTAAMAFLNALKAKDKDRLSQATALRAPTEAMEKHRKIFAAIVEQSISDDELDEMSKAMSGFQVVQVLPAKSTGRIGVLVAKMDGRDMLQRTLTTRKEKEGWKVMDISDMYDFKAGLPPIFMRGGRRR